MNSGLTPRLLSDILEIPLSQAPNNTLDIPFTSVTTDSRKVTPGCLFVAIPGDHFDGNDFVDKSLAQGAHGVLCRQGAVKTSASSQAFIFEAADSLAAFRRLSAAWRARFQIPIAMVAGSAGKTTTKELLAAILSGSFGEGKVLKTQGSNNGFVGIPITLMDLNAEHRAAVIEVGIDEPGSMAQHLNIVKPVVSVLTSIGPEHLEKLIDVATVAHEEGLAFETAIREGGKIAVNMDDPFIEPWFKKAPPERRLAYSLKLPASQELLHGELSSDGASLQVEGAGISASFPLPLPGQHNAMNLLGAIATARLLGLDANAMLSGLKNFVAAEGRSQVRELRDRVHVLCDYYNSQPKSLTAAVDLLGELAARLAPGGERWACLGDMLELGPEELRFHREIAPKILALKLEHVLLFGERMKALQNELLQKGYAGDLRHFESRDALAGALTSEIKGPATVLIKGSRGMKMEEVWKRLESR
ncbi:MAG: UDP-N-acetylmuramoyl-tripeptide--D-alanyl-D-alanine ligase [Oligoflexia bacterium]|nr:UDP-N-acetylmuramoyl-tripeptide--D-alanyl-D-alanine ligase [Oligoflexia bacterium]